MQILLMKQCNGGRGAAHVHSLLHFEPSRMSQTTEDSFNNNKSHKLKLFLWIPNGLSKNLAKHQKPSWKEYCVFIWFARIHSFLWNSYENLLRRKNTAAFFVYLSWERYIPNMRICFSDNASSGYTAAFYISVNRETIQISQDMFPMTFCISQLRGRDNPKIRISSSDNGRRRRLCVS